MTNTRSMPYDRSKAKIKVTVPLRFRKLNFARSISSAVYNGSWQMTTDS